MTFKDGIKRKPQTCFLTKSNCVYKQNIGTQFKLLILMWAEYIELLMEKYIE